MLYCLIIVLKDIMEVECCNLDELPQKDLETFVNNCFLDGLFACGCNTEIKYEGYIKKEAEQIEHMIGTHFDFIQISCVLWLELNRE